LENGCRYEEKEITKGCAGNFHKSHKIEKIVSITKKKQRIKEKVSTIPEGQAAGCDNKSLRQSED
jgi:hypothetical protein